MNNSSFTLNIFDKKIVFDKRLKQNFIQAIISPKYNLRNVILALIIGFVLSIIIGFAVYQEHGARLIIDLFRGDFLDSTTTSLWVDKVVVLGLGGIAVAIGMKTGLLNIGVSGQMLGGAIIAILITKEAKSNSIAGRAILEVIITIIASTFIAFFTGILKAFFKVNEVVSSIMINWVFVYVCMYMKDPGTETIALKGAPTSVDISNDSKLLNHGYYTQVFDSDNSWLLAGIGIILLVLVAVAFFLVIYKTSIGFKLRATGLNSNASSYAGYRSKSLILTSFALSGAVAGLAGFMFYFMSGTSIDSLNAPTQEGFQALAVSLIALNNPLGCILSSAVFSLLVGPIGGISLGGLPANAILIFTGIITYFVSITTLFIYFKPGVYIIKWKVKLMQNWKPKKTNVNIKKGVRA